MGYIKTLKEAEQLLTDNQEFNAGSLTATWELGETHTTNRHYVVRSYGVMIAWLGDYNLEILPSAYTHSKTTSKHANIVARAWGLR
jgi:hypothetical protein